MWIMIKSLSLSLIRCHLRCNESFCFECNDIKTKMAYTFQMFSHTHTYTQPLTSQSKSKLKNVSLYVLKLHRWYLCSAGVGSATVLSLFPSYFGIKMPFDLRSQLVSWIWFNLLSIFSVLGDQHLAINTNLFFYFLERISS